MSDAAIAVADAMRALFTRLKTAGITEFILTQSKDSAHYSGWDGKHWKMLDAPDGAQLAGKVKEELR